MTQEEIEIFINWVQENAPDAWWVFEHKEEAINQFLIWYNENK